MNEQEEDGQYAERASHRKARHDGKLRSMISVLIHHQSKIINQIFVKTSLFSFQENRSTEWIFKITLKRSVGTMGHDKKGMKEKDNG
jgi:hypothetical protein